MGVQRADDDLPVGVSDALVHQVATGDRRRELILLRREFPDDLADFVQMNGVDVVGIGAFEVHHVADYQRLPLLAAERASGHGPGDSELADVFGIDLGQFAMTNPAITAERQHPLIRVLGIFLQRFIGKRNRRGDREDRCHAQPFHVIHVKLLYSLGSET